MQTQADSDRLNYNLASNFKVREFVCSCCGAEGIKDHLVFFLQNAHDRLPKNRVMVVTSGYRCQEHNEAIGGVENSAHTKGLAADIKFDDSSHKFMLIKAFLSVGFKRIGIYDSFIHVDIDKTKAQNVMW
jgi:uncharacterized protein YcbK (DUF882 family)